jgi:hypothetical protein
MLSPSPIAVVPIRQQRAPIAVTLPPKRLCAAIADSPHSALGCKRCAECARVSSYGSVSGSAHGNAHVVVGDAAKRLVRQGCSVLCSSASDVAAEPARHRRRPSGSVIPAAQQAATHRCATGYRPSQPCHRVPPHMAPADACGWSGRLGRAHTGDCRLAAFQFSFSRPAPDASKPSLGVCHLCISSSSLAPSSTETTSTCDTFFDDDDDHEFGGSPGCSRPSSQ